MWGFITSLNDILIPHLKSIFDLSYARAMLIQFAFFSAYFLFGMPWSWIVNAIGYQKSMVAGLLGMALGAGLFIPAAQFASFPLFLGALIVLAAGITGPAGRGEPLRRRARQAGDRVEPIGSGAGVQLARHHARARARRSADPEHGAVGDGRDPPPLAARRCGSIACSRPPLW